MPDPQAFPTSNRPPLQQAAEDCVAARDADRERPDMQPALADMRDSPRGPRRGA